METTTLSFILGMVAMVILTSIVMIITAMVKISKLKREVQSLTYHIENLDRNIYDDLKETKRELSKNLESQVDILIRNMDGMEREVKAYTDSRIDKQEKKLIKG